MIGKNEAVIDISNIPHWCEDLNEESVGKIFVDVHIPACYIVTQYAVPNNGEASWRNGMLIDYHFQYRAERVN